MVTQIDNSHRVFMLTGDMNRSIFCNLNDIPTAIADFDDKDSIKFFHFWNQRQKKVSVNHLNDLFESNQLDFRIKIVGVR